MKYLKAFFIFSLSILIIYSSIAQKTKTEVLIDNFDNVSGSQFIEGNWFTYTDNTIAGKSVGTNLIETESKSKNKYMAFSYKLNKGECQWNPYAALSCNIRPSAIPSGVQAISYRFKGNAHMLVVKTSNIKDYCYYNITIPASSIWTTVTVPVSELKQPLWGKEALLNMRTFEGLSWQVTGKTDDTGMVSIDDLNLLYTPQLAINPIPAPQRGIQIDSIHTIHSTILNEDRIIAVYLPASYDATQPDLKKYPVVYLLDGESFIEYMAGVIEKSSAPNYNTVFPKMIVVGIINTNRTRDLSPTHISENPFSSGRNRFDASGGGPAFMSFIEKELMPKIEKTYPTTNYKTFVGHSLGGLTVVNALIHQPYLFDAYLALDPSLWWDNQLLLKQADASFGKINLNNKKLYIAIANDLYKGIDTAQVKQDTSSFFFPLKANLSFVDILTKHSDNGLKWSYTYYPDENHSTVPEIGIVDGMNYFFKLNQSDINKHFTITATPFGSGFTLSNPDVPTDMGYTMYPPEKLLNDYAYACLAKKNDELALSLFEMNKKNYPLSPFVFDALGDYYAATGDVEEARKNYLQALLLGEGRLEQTKRKLEKLN